MFPRTLKFDKIVLRVADEVSILICLNEFAAVPSGRNHLGRINVMISNKFPRANNIDDLKRHLFAS